MLFDMIFFFDKYSIPSLFAVVDCNHLFVLHISHIAQIFGYAWKAAAYICLTHHSFHIPSSIPRQTHTESVLFANVPTGSSDVKIRNFKCKIRNIKKSSNKHQFMYRFCVWCFFWDCARDFNDKNISMVTFTTHFVCNNLPDRKINPLCDPVNLR